MKQGRESTIYYKTVIVMKNIIILMLIILCFDVSDIVAQQSDTLQSVRFMKRKSKQFIVKIKTNEGNMKGLLYSADYTGIVLLDSNYREHFYAVSDIKYLEIRRVNAFWYGLKVPFLFLQGGSLALVTPIILYGALVGEASYSLIFLLIPLYVAPFAVIGSIAIATMSGIIPAIKIKSFNQEEYNKKYEFIAKRTQKYLIKKFPHQPRMIIE